MTGVPVTSIPKAFTPPGGYGEEMPPPILASGVINKLSRTVPVEKS